MKRILTSLSIVVGAWVLISFGGAMFDPGNANLWTQSLMASLLTSLVVAPALFVLRQRNGQAPATKTDATPRQAKPKAQAEKPFVDEDSGQMRTLWPQQGDDADRQPATTRSRQTV